MVVVLTLARKTRASAVPSAYTRRPHTLCRNWNSTLRHQQHGASDQGGGLPGTPLPTWLQGEEATAQHVVGGGGGHTCRRCS